MLNIGSIFGTLSLEDKFTKVLNDAVYKTKVASRAIEMSAKKAQKFKTAFGSMQNVGASMLPISAAITGIGVASIKMATDFNKSMANISTLIPNSTERVNELKTGIQDLAQETGKSTKDLSDGMYQVISAFGDSSESMERLEVNAKAAAAGMATTTDAINLTSAVTKGYGDVSAEAMKKASDLAFMTVKLGQTTFPELASSIGAVVPIASALNVAQEELFAGFATLTGVTGNAAEVSTQLKSVMTAMLSPSKEMAEAMKNIGVESVDAMIQQYGLVGSMQKLIESTDGSKEAIGELFPNVRALPAVFALSGGQAETFAQKLNQMQDAAGATNEAYLEMTEGINKAGHEFEQAKQKIVVAMQNLGDAILPIITIVFNVFGTPLISILSAAIKIFSALPMPIRAVAVAYAGLAVAIGPALFAIGTIGPRVMSAITLLKAFRAQAILSRIAALALNKVFIGFAVAAGAIKLGSVILKMSGLDKEIKNVMSDMWEIIKSSAGLNIMFAEFRGMVHDLGEAIKVNAETIRYWVTFGALFMVDALTGLVELLGFTLKFVQRLGASINTIVEYSARLSYLISRQQAYKDMAEKHAKAAGDFLQAEEKLDAVIGEVSNRLMSISAEMANAAAAQDKLGTATTSTINYLEKFKAAIQGMSVGQLQALLQPGALDKYAEAFKLPIERMRKLIEATLQGKIASAEFNKEITKIVNELTGLDRSKELDKTIAAVNRIGDASKISDDKIQQLAKDLQEAASKDKDIGKLGQEIIDLAAKIEKVNQAWSDAEGERKRQADLIGGYYSEVEQGYLDIESAISQATKGTMDYGKLSDAQLQRVAAKLQQLSVEATAGKYSIDGLDDQLRAAFLEIQKRMPENSWLAEFFKQVTHGEIRKGWLKVSDYINTARDAIMAFGFSADSAFAQALSGASSFAQGMADIRTATTPLGQIQAGVSIAQGAVQVLDSVFGGKENWEKVAEEIGNTFGTTISDSLAQTISETSAQVAGMPAEILGTFMEGVIDETDRYTASLIHLGDIMAEGLESGFGDVGNYKQGIADLFNAIEDGTISARQGLESLGDVWDQLAEQAEAGDAKAQRMMISMMQTAIATGNIPQQMADSMAAGVDQMISGLEMVLGGLQNVGEAQGELFASAFWAAVGTKGLLAASDALKESWEQLPEEILAGLGDVARLMDLTQLNEAFRGAAEVGQGLADMVEGMGAANLITAESFQNLGQTALEAFEQAIAGGASEAEAITAILPYLAQAKQMAELYGIELDENTQRLIEQAEQAGYAFPAEPQQVMIDLLREIVTVLGGEIPESAQIAAESMSQASEKISEDAGKAADGITSKMSQVPEELASLFNGLPESFDQLSGSAIDAFQKLAEKSGQSVDSIWAKLQELQNKKLQIELEISTKTGSSGNGGKVKGKVTPMAEGGIVTRPTFGLMGEAGPEAIIPLSELGMIQNNNNTAEMRQMMKDQTDILTNTLVKIMRDSLLQAQ